MSAKKITLMSLSFVALCCCSSTHPHVQSAVGVCEISEKIEFFSGKIVTVRARAIPGVNFDVVLDGEECKRIIILNPGKDGSSYKDLMKILFTRKPGDLAGSLPETNTNVEANGEVVWQREAR